MAELSQNSKSKIGEPKKFFGQIPIIGQDKPISNIKPQTNIEDVIGEYGNKEAAKLRYEQTHAYNQNIDKLDSNFTKLQPLKKILIRHELVEGTYNEKLDYYDYPSITVDVPTRNGVSVLSKTESPWPYSNIARIISLPPSLEDNPKFQVGARIMLPSSLIKVTAVDDTGSNFEVPYMFIHPDIDYVPDDITDTYYGYSLIGISIPEMII